MKIDFHSHVLPGIDDGSRSVLESIRMLKMEASQGIRHVVATPHFYSHRDNPTQFLVRRQESELRLREEMEKHSDLPKLSIGAEVFYFRGISESSILPDLTIDHSDFLLLEMPVGSWSKSILEDVEQIYYKQGITPIIAHVDRYMGTFRTYGIPKLLQRMPVLVQANAGFVLRSSTRARALRMIRRDQIQLFGSDCHNMTTRLPNLGSAYQLLEKRLGTGKVASMNEFGLQLLDNSLD